MSKIIFLKTVFVGLFLLIPSLHAADVKAPPPDMSETTSFQTFQEEDWDYIAHYNIFFEPGAQNLELMAEEVIALAVEHAIASDASHILISGNPNGVNSTSQALETAERLGSQLKYALKTENLPDHTAIAFFMETLEEVSLEKEPNRLEITVYPAGSTFPMRLSYLLQ